MKGTIKMRDLSFSINIGVSEEERQHPQMIFVDLEIETDITKAVETDNIHNTINYSKVQKSVEQFLENKEYRLIERLTDDIATLLLARFPKIEKITCTCWKPLALKQAKNVGVEIVKERK